MQAWVLSLLEGDAPLADVGGKALNLTRLVAGGFPVPPGFVLRTNAYRAFVEHNQMAPMILEELAGIDAASPSSLTSASTIIRLRFRQGVVPTVICAAIREAYAALGSLPVAVRSSATAEDLPNLSFAGQQDTVLNVIGEEALLEAVIHCWSSLWTARAIGYRARNGLAQDDLALAVVVQVMIPSEVAGVLFTANPLNGRRTEMVIEATLGLGEALVAGQVEPDYYLIEAESGKILNTTLGAKDHSIRPTAGGGTATRPEQASDRQALPDAAIAELARLGRQVAEYFCSPQDIEWAWAGGHLSVLQSRPITSLFPVPAALGPDPLKVLFSFGAVQGLLGPMTPLGRDAISGVLLGTGRLFGYRLALDNQQLVYTAAERLFVNITALLRNRVGRRLARGALGFVEPSAQQAVESLLDDARLPVAGGLRAGAIRRILPFLLPAMARQVRTLLRPDAHRVKFQADLDAFLADFGASLASASNLLDCVVLLDEIGEQVFPFALPRFVPRLGAGMFSMTLLNRLIQGVPTGDHDVLVLTRGLPHNVTTEMDLALWEVAQCIRSDADSRAHFHETPPERLARQYLVGGLPEPARAAVRSFLERYGMRGLGEIDLGRPRWREDPMPIMGTLQSYLLIDDPQQAPDAVFARGAFAAQDAVQSLVEDLRRAPRGWLKARLARGAARRLRALVGLRESPKLWIIRLMGMVREALLEQGRRLVTAGMLERHDDLFYLHRNEVIALAGGQERDWRSLVRRRRETYAREERRAQVPRLLLSDGQAYYEGIAAREGDSSLSESGETIMVGSPVSPGVVEGQVRIVMDPGDAQLVPGEILVCPGTDPAWTPLFLVARGLVMEVGGIMTHGSVVAREYGIPAVVGVSRATTRLRTGQRIRVDGSRGKIVVLEGP
jgi:pyruvate,water dikinase